MHQINKNERRQELYNLLGKLPEENSAPECIKISEEENEHYILEKLILHLNGIEPVPAYFVRPKLITDKTPVVLYNHAHCGDYAMGKDELIKGRSMFQNPDYAVALSKKGYAVLCIDCWAFGERRGRTESEIFKEMLWYGRVMWGMMLYDSIRAVDYLVSRQDIDPKCIATLGMSMGSTMAWWLAALDPRIKVCVDICCLTDYSELIKHRGLDGHGIYYYVPDLLNHFTTAQINSLISPRPHLSLLGRYDKLTPVTGIKQIDGEIAEVYRVDGAQDAWRLIVSNTSHYETAYMRSEIMQFLEKWL